MEAVTVAPSVVSNAAPSPAASAFASYPVPVQPSHVLLTPFILPETVEALLSSGAFGGQTKNSIKSLIQKVTALPLTILVPSAVIIAGLVWCVFFNLLPTYFPNFWKKLLAMIDPGVKSTLTVTPTTPKPYFDKSPYSPFINYYRQRREANESSTDGTPTSDGPATALPALSMAQVEKLTDIVFAALRSQQCIQRLLCEAGTMSRSFSETAHSVARIVERFVPESIKDSYEIFANADKCDQYICGTLYVKK